MPLTLYQFLGLVLTLVIVVVATWFILFLRQLKRTAEEAEKALAELRHNLQEFNELQALIKEKAERIGETIESSRKIASNLAEILGLVTAKLIKPASSYWPLIFPIIQFLWRQKKKRKEKSHG